MFTRSLKQDRSEIRIDVPARAFIQSTVTGALKEFSLALNFFSASVVPVASEITLPACAGPRYSRMLLNWSVVGAVSWTSAQGSRQPHLFQIHVLSCNFVSPTELKLCPLQLALRGMVGCLVLCSGRGSVCCRLFQERVRAHRSLVRGLVEESDDILLGGL